MSRPRKPPVVPNLDGPLLPMVEGVAADRPGHQIQRLLGFWVLWHTYGGIDALIGTGIVTNSSAYRQRSEFLIVMGAPVDQWQPDLAAVLAGRTPARSSVPS